MTVVLVGLVSGSVAFADPTATDVSHGYVPKYWSMMASIVRTNSLYVNEDGADLQAVDYVLTPVIPLSKDYTFSFLVDISQDLTVDRSDYGPFAMTLTKSSGYQLFGDYVKAIPRVSLGFPLDQGSIATSLEVSTKVGSRFEFNPEHLFSKRLGLAFDLSGTRNWHRYTTAISGNVNKEYTAGQTFEVSWGFSDSFSAIASLTHYDMWSYDGYASDAFSHTEELDYQISPKWIVAAGHQWGNPYVGTLGPNGQDLNFEAMDQWNSLVYAQITLVL